MSESVEGIKFVPPRPGQTKGPLVHVGVQVAPDETVIRKVDFDRWKAQYDADNGITLRAAGAEDMETCPTCWQPVPRPQRGDHDYGIPLRAAQPEDDGLDVERLRQALDNEWHERLLNPPGWDEGSDIDPFRERAPRIAAEYARLSESSEEVERRDGA